MTSSLKVSSVAALILVWSWCAASAQQTSNSVNSSAGPSNQKSSAGTALSDTKFVKEAAEGGMAEVALGQLAAQRGSSNEVKQFGQRMVNDHSKANNELKQLASEKKITLPQRLNAKDKATKATLEKLSGEDFDDAYMQDMVKDHKKDISDFRRESNSAQDPDIKNFATNTLPTLEQHLKQAETIAPQVARSTSSH